MLFADGALQGAIIGGIIGAVVGIIIAIVKKTTSGKKGDDRG